MKRIYHLPHDEFVRELRETYDGIPDQLLGEPEILELMLPIVRADLQIVADHTYEAQRPLDCPISAFGGINDRWVGEAQLSEWAIQTTAQFTLSMFPGDHYYLNPAQDQLFARIASLLR